VERLVHDANLAWAVAEAAKPHLSDTERNAVFVAIGAGETFTAIRQLFRLVGIKRIPLGPELLRQCRTWLQAYGGHEDERYLRRLIEEPLIPYVKPVQLAALTSLRDTHNIRRPSGSGYSACGFANRPQNGQDNRESTVGISSSATDVRIGVTRGTG
jgi:hypothetical protein